MMKKLENRFCAWCGKEFAPVCVQQICCCKECAKKRNKDFAEQRNEQLRQAKRKHQVPVERKKPKKSKKEKDPNSLTEVARLAKEAGMTYGQYVASEKMQTKRR